MLHVYFIELFFSYSDEHFAGEYFLYLFHFVFSLRMLLSETYTDVKNNWHKEEWDFVRNCARINYNIRAYTQKSTYTRSLCVYWGKTGLIRLPALCFAVEFAFSHLLSRASLMQIGDSIMIFFWFVRVPNSTWAFLIANMCQRKLSFWMTLLFFRIESTSSIFFMSIRLLLLMRRLLYEKNIIQYFIT